MGIDAMLGRVKHHTTMDKRTLEKIIDGEIKSSTDTPLLRRLFKIASHGAPYSQDEQEMIVLYRRIKQAQPDAAAALLKHASERAERAEELVQDELRLAEKRRQLTE